MKAIFSNISKQVTIFTFLAIIIFLIAGCAPSNHSQITINLKAERDIVPPSGGCQIECIVSGLENGDLSYDWRANGGSILSERATAIWSAPDKPGEYTISVNVTDTEGNEATQSITVTVRENHPPQINSLSTNDEWVVPSGNCTITCEASDPDNDELSYVWLANKGAISGTGATASWTAPKTMGIYTITVKVIDVMGAESTGSLHINVAPNNPPIIEDLVVTAKEPKYLKKTAGGYTVGNGKSYEIECVASDPDDSELSYEWSSYEGSSSISSTALGEGTTIVWTAPLRSTNVTIMVTVLDGNGGATTESIAFTVVPCNKCTFG